MLQPDAFCALTLTLTLGCTMQQNATAATPQGELTALPQTPYLRGEEGEGKGGKVDSDAQFEQGRRLFKAAFDMMI